MTCVTHTDNCQGRVTAFCDLWLVSAQHLLRYDWLGHCLIAGNHWVQFLEWSTILQISVQQTIMTMHFGGVWLASYVSTFNRTCGLNTEKNSKHWPPHRPRKITHSRLLDESTEFWRNNINISIHCKSTWTNATNIPLAPNLTANCSPAIADNLGLYLSVSKICLIYGLLLTAVNMWSNRTEEQLTTQGHMENSH